VSERFALLRPSRLRNRFQGVRPVRPRFTLVGEGEYATIRHARTGLMKIIRTRLFHTVVDFTVGCLLLVASPLRAQDDCKQMERLVADAFSKVHNTPTHVYTTSKIGNQTFNSEIIYAAGNMYMKINGKWTLSDSIKDIEQTEQQARHNAHSNDTCRYVKDEPVNGEMASLYSSHSETPKGKIDMQTWISKSNGLLLRQETASSGVVNSSRYEYANVKPPL
jgi:hypothetical protein